MSLCISTPQRLHSSHEKAVQEYPKHNQGTAALDSHRGRQVMGLFRMVAHEHKAGVIVVTHDHRALDVFDRIFEMEDGIVRPSTAGG